LTEVSVSAPDTYPAEAQVVAYPTFPTGAVIVGRGPGDWSVRSASWIAAVMTYKIVPGGDAIFNDTSEAITRTISYQEGSETSIETKVGCSVEAEAGFSGVLR
jgi:hypothetical protein